MVNELDYDTFNLDLCCLSSFPAVGYNCKSFSVNCIRLSVHSSLNNGQGVGVGVGLGGVSLQCSHFVSVKRKYRQMRSGDIRVATN